MTAKETKPTHIDSREFQRITTSQDGTIKQVVFIHGKRSPMFVPAEYMSDVQGVPEKALKALKANDADAAAKALSGFKVRVAIGK